MPPTVSRSARAASIRSRSSSSSTVDPVDLDPDRREQRLRDAARGDVHGGVARRGALERVADVVEVVLEHARKVGVAGPRQRDRLRSLALRLALRRPRAHPPRPVLVILVPDDERERRPDRLAVPEPGEHLDAILLDLLARRAAVALLAALEVGVDRVAVELETGREARQDRDEPGPVRLSCGGETKRHGPRDYGPLRTASRMTATGAGTPVQSSKLFAPWRTSASSPSITSHPAARAAATSAVSAPSARVGELDDRLACDAARRAARRAPASRSRSGRSPSHPEATPRGG